MIRSIILDDEKHGIATLEWLITKNVSEVEIVKTFTSPIKAIDFLKKNQIDLIFLDIEMPEMSGFEFLKKIDSNNLNVIFTTAYDEFAIHAFKISAIDYLLKPIDKSDIIQAIEKIKKNTNVKVASNQLEVLFNNITNFNHLTERIILPTQEGLFFVKTNEIMYCISDSNYTNIYIENGKTFLVSKTIKKIDEILPKQSFVRIHNSHIININKITKYIRGDGGYVIMDNKKMLSVSRSRKDILLKALQTDIIK